jgi:eukaryotic-like serine/threonine-protein kinase
MRCHLSEDDVLAMSLGETADEALLAHLETCGDCRQRLQHRRGEMALLRHAACTPLEKNSLAFAKPPAVVGKYPIVGVLGRGAQGIVYRAVHPMLNVDLAIKLSNHALEEEDPQRDLLVREGKLLARVQHPHLVRVIDLDFHDSRPFLAFEYIHGRNLQQFLEEKRPAPRQAALLVAQLARALAAVHHHGIIHQDIKPANILIDEHGDARLLDFGLARFRSVWAEHTDQPSGGTAAFMAPEQARDELDRISPASDIFALGGVLFFLLTGQPPFQGQGWHEARQRAARCEFDRSAIRTAGAPRRLEAICLRAMAADPAHRHAKAEEFAKELERFARGRTIPVWWLAAAAALLLLVTAWWLFRPGSDRQASSPPGLLVEWVQRKSGDEITISRDLKGALPLQIGDLIRLSCEVPADLQSTMFWWDARAELTELNPVLKNGKVYYPAQGSARLERPAGTQFVFICGSRSGPPARKDVAPFFKLRQPWPTLPKNILVVLQRQNVLLEAGGVGQATPDQIRGHLGRPEADALSQVEETVERLRAELCERFEFVAGVAFVLCEPSPD